MAAADLHARYLVEAVFAALHHAPLARPDFEVNEELLLSLIRAHHQSALLYPLFRDAGDLLSAPSLDQLRRDSLLDQTRSASQADELEELTEAFGQESIRFLMLKGIVMKRYYEKPALRMMGDLDLLIAPADRARARQVMESLGYETQSYEELYDDVYYRRPFLNVEIHVALGKPEDFSDPVFETVWDRAVFDPAFPWRGELSPEDFYLYFIHHSAKHFKGHGTGVRTVIDQWVLMHGLLPTLDRARLEKSLSALDRLTFERELTRLAAAWFDGEGEDPFFGEPMRRFLILSGGLYGNVENTFYRQTVQDTDVKGAHSRKRVVFLQRIFLSREKMAVRYPVLTKHGWLLPFFWIWRIFRTLIHPNKVKGEVRLYQKVSAGMDLQTELRERFGFLPESSDGQDRH